MAFNFSVFKTRAISAIFFVVVMVGGLLWNKWSFLALFTIIQAGGLFEFEKLMCLIFPNYANKSKVHRWGLLAMGVSLMMTLSVQTQQIGNLNLRLTGAIATGAILIIVIIADVIKKQFSLQNVAISFFGLIYIPMSLSLFFQLKQIFSAPFMEEMLSLSIPLLVIVSIWVNDTMAYIVGSIIGRTPLSSVSPNKTWEGTIAGAIIAVLVVTKLFGVWIPIKENIIFVISIVSCIAGTFGDLFESKLKRLAGVKDSGHMMPGHGGFLDRFDSILFAVPFVWLILQFLF
jgi:phosphatidate cytidylyltransferase